MILSGETIRREIKIAPFTERFVHVATGMSYGLSIAGYDVRLREGLMAYPSEFQLGSILEHIEMPNDVLGVVHDKSSWARQGIALQNTIIEPGWRGHLTVEISNHGRNPIFILPGSPIAQIIFHVVDRICVPYRGKYQDQPAHPVGALREEKV